MRHMGEDPQWKRTAEPNQMVAGEQLVWGCYLFLLVGSEGNQKESRSHAGGSNLKMTSHADVSKRSHVLWTLNQDDTCAGGGAFR